ncbi:helix-turn-helix domain-containing protein [Bradymonadaceae bacterium TMQ3]|nr:helix-turn-helix domain-containing protein [Bradymonadaceae bacterium TMQ3]TXC67868.1 helix-turn-helix domain-containing protein [Bradymonadales bacterium TMQ1]
MPKPTTLSFVRTRRTAAELSQAELARRVGVSRQTLNAIETGRQVPSTTIALQLARALRCTVDELFRLPGGPLAHVRLAEPGQVSARVSVGRVEGALVGHPCRIDARSADGRVVEYDAESRRALIELFSETADIEHNLLIAGCAPLLGVVSDRIARRYRNHRATWIYADSSRALELLAGGFVHVAGMHLASEEDAQAHVRAAQTAFPGERTTLVNLARWRQGLVVAPGNPRALRPGSGLGEPELRRALRAPGSGARRVFERAGGGQVFVRESDCIAADHAEVARLVKWGIADVGVAIESVARTYDLDFIPLSEERFDLLIPESRCDDPAIARLIDLIDGPSFRNEAAYVPGYDLSLAGHASTVAAVSG